MITKPSFIIVGGGMAGAFAVQTLRDEGSTGGSPCSVRSRMLPMSALPCPRTTSRAKLTGTASSSTQSLGTPSTQWTCLWAQQ
jgi:hypothetical protein